MCLINKLQHKSNEALSDTSVCVLLLISFSIVKFRAPLQHFVPIRPGYGLITTVLFSIHLQSMKFWNKMLQLFSLTLQECLFRIFEEIPLCFLIVLQMLHFS